MKTGFWADLFTTVCGCYWDLARIASAIIIATVITLAVYRCHIGQVPTLSEYADAMMKVFLGCAAFIGGKDVARAYSTKGAAS